MIDRDLKPDNVLEAELAVPCGICLARIGQRCTSLVNAAQVMPMSHYTRRRLAVAAAENAKESHAT